MTPAGLEVLGNTIRNAAADGISVTAPSRVTPEPALAAVKNNTVRDSGEDGIHFESGTSRNTIQFNSSLGSGAFDCLDETTGDNPTNTANFWGTPPTRNIGRTDMPASICRRPEVRSDQVVLI